MEGRFPGTICRVGQTDSSRKIFIEEYTVSFLQEIIKNVKEPQMIVFFGDGYERGGTRYYYIKGAAAHRACGSMLRRMDEFYFQTVGKQYFEGMKGIGWYCLETGNVEVLEILQNMREQDFRDMKGYYVYFEKNEAMEEYMLHWQQKEKRQGGAAPARKKECPRRRGVHLPKAGLFSAKRSAITPILAVQLLNMISLCILIICSIIAVTTLNQYDKMKRLEETVTYLETSIEEEKNLPDE